MTITGMTRFVQQNYKVQNSHLTHKLPNGSLPPKEHVNPYCPEGMDITGRTDFRRIVPVDEGVANKIKSLVFESMEKNCGMSDGEIESESSVILAVHGPIKRIRNMSIVDTISAQ